MASSQARARLGSRGKPEESRSAILQAAIREFAREGVAGARTDAIAKTAKVNKALLYYYFRDKDALYAAALEQVFKERDAHLMPILRENTPPGEKLLRTSTGSTAFPSKAVPRMFFQCGVPKMHGSRRTGRESRMFQTKSGKRPGSATAADRRRPSTSRV